MDIKLSDLRRLSGFGGFARNSFPAPGQRVQTISRAGGATDCYAEWGSEWQYVEAAPAAAALVLQFGGGMVAGEYIPLACHRCTVRPAQDQAADAGDGLLCSECAQED